MVAPPTMKFAAADEDADDCLAVKTLRHNSAATNLKLRHRSLSLGQKVRADAIVCSDNEMWRNDLVS